MMSKEFEQDILDYVIAMELAEHAGPIDKHPVVKENPKIAALAEEIRKVRMDSLPKGDCQVSS